MLVVETGDLNGADLPWESANMTESQSDLSERILDTALVLAQEHGWENIRLHDVARALGISLDDIRQHYREKEDLVDTWFDRADAAMLKEAELAGFESLSAHQKLHRLIMAWLGALAPYRRVTRQMLVNKLEPGHLHVQIPALMRISRTVQWLREAAGITASWTRRAFEETTLTGIYLLTFSGWLFDDSPRAERTSRVLDRLLGIADKVACGAPWRQRASAANTGVVGHHNAPGGA